MTNALALLPGDFADFTVIATSPKDMETSQNNLIGWCDGKIALVQRDLDDAAGQLAICQQRKWSTNGWRREVTKHGRRIDFYKKVKMALEAGYYIVPPFPIDIFAIRVNRSSPVRRDGTNSNNHDQLAQVLPAGEGRYVDPRPFVSSRQQIENKTINHQTGEKKNVPVTYYYASDYDKVEFPFKLARAEIKEAALKAMAGKFFDKLGVLPRVRKPDPIVCGQILYPDQRTYLWNPDSQQGLTLFVAWWLDTKTIKV